MRIPGENAAKDFRKLRKAPAVTPRPLDGADPVICSEPLMEKDYPLSVARYEVTCTDRFLDNPKHHLSVSVYLFHNLILSH